MYYDFQLFLDVCIKLFTFGLNWFLKSKGAFVWEYSGIRMYSGIFSGYSAPGSRIARMESRFSGMRIAPKQTLNCIIPIILIPD